MNKIALAILMLSLSTALADDFKTINGKEYKDAKVSRVEPDGLVLMTKSGISKVYFVELPEDVQQHFGYGPAKAAEFNKAELPAAGQFNANVQPATPQQRIGDSGSAAELRNLGWLYQHGKGVSQNYEKAAELYQKPAEAGDAAAEANLAHLYIHGLGVPQDYRRAFDLAQRSAAQGDPVGETNLGDMYHHGWGVKQDCNKAVTLYTKAADQGYADAMAYLSAIYLNGECVPRNAKKAAELIQKAFANRDREENQPAPVVR